MRHRSTRVRDNQRDRYTEKHTERQTDRETERQADRQTDRLWLWCSVLTLQLPGATSMCELNAFRDRMAHQPQNDCC